ncbi:hypothetical protein [Candidatus Berkiella aquae]|uniref:Uncharacterized protein n=1 Tax=Candidatus Berkiella aquae TaxID=295108 RepID=A0A0Q9YGQ7_9GAMM|nr:hypothetical protein [Candidatus Berkiella aquae]MCS5710832.1 hypothetical protein [Candidatus Berkiella aquae]
MLKTETVKNGLFFGATLLAVAILISFLYWKGLNGPFLLDDLQSIEGAQLTTFSWGQLIDISLQNDSGPLGRPLSIASFALNHYFFGLNPFYYKLINLFIHILCGFAIGLFIYLLMTLIPKAKPFAKRISFFTALLWLIHPLQVSTVLYPVQRMTQLCHLCIILGLNTYLWGRIRQFTDKSYGLLLMAISYVWFFPLALLCKETGIIFPWYVFLIEYFLLKYKGAAQNGLYLKRFHQLFCLGLLFSFLFYYWYHLETNLALFADKNITLFDRLLTQLNVLVFYLKLILIPQLADMGLYHDDFGVITGFNLQTVLCSVLLFSLAIVIYIGRKRAPIISFGIAWFFVSHAIESTILPLEMVFEHRNYLASVGLLLIPIYYFVPFMSKVTTAPKRIYALFSFLLFAMLATITLQRSIIWSSSGTFLQESLLHHPLSPRVHIEIANVLLQEQQFGLAFESLEEAARLDPYNAGIALHKILIHCQLQSVPPALYQEAKQKIQQGAITPYVITVLDIMIQNMFNKQCSSVDRNKIIELLRLCYNNPFLKYKPRYKAVLYHLEAGLELLNTNLDKSRFLLLKSYETYPKRIDPLLQKAYLEMRYGLYEEAEKSVSYAHQQLSKNKLAKAKLQKLDFAMQAIKLQSQKE